MPALVRDHPKKGGDADCRVSSTDRAVRDQRIAVASCRYLCCSRGRRHDVLEVAVEFGDACHERVPRVERSQREGRIENEIRRIAIRIIVAAHPSAVDSIRFTRSIMAEAKLHDDPTRVHIVRQVIAKYVGICKWIITKRNDNVVQLELGQGGSGGSRLIEICRGDAWRCQDLRLESTGLAAAVGIYNKNLEAACC